jgi:hypothetical protein
MAARTPALSATRSWPGTTQRRARLRICVSRSSGPYDRSEVDGLGGRLDLGSLWLTGIPGMELRLEVEQECQSLVGVTAVLGESAVQLQAFAAPRSQASGKTSAPRSRQHHQPGGTADKTHGPLERAAGPDAGPGPDGRTVFSPARFVGVDGLAGSCVPCSAVGQHRRGCCRPCSTWSRQRSSSRRRGHGPRELLR